MMTYLNSGWFGKKGQSSLRTEVVDGAIDAAGMLLRTGVPPDQIGVLALRVRSLVVVADPLMRGSSKFGKAEREALTRRLDPITERYPALHGFTADCIEHVKGARDLIAFYLHLIHVQRMVQLLAHAMGLTGAFAVQPDAPVKKKARKKTKKKTSKSKKKKKEKEKRSTQVRVLPLVVLVSTLGCERSNPLPKEEGDFFFVKEIGLAIPQLPGWVQDHKVKLKDPHRGGKLIKLERESRVLGSPRVTVHLAPITAEALNLEGYLREHMRAMAELESAGKINVSEVHEGRVKVGPRKGHRVRHEFTDVASGVSLTQVQVLLVLDGRGVTVYAGGRTELFHPLANDITAMLNGLKTPAIGGAIKRPEIKSIKVKPLDPKEKRPLVAPIDLKTLKGDEKE